MKIRTRVIGSVLTVVALVCALFLAYILNKESTDAYDALQSNIDRTHELIKQTLPGPLYDGNVVQLNAYLDSVYRDPDVLEIGLSEYNGDIRLSRKRLAPPAGGRTLGGKVVIMRGIDPLGEITTVYTSANIERRLVESRNEILLFAAALMIAVGFVIFKVANSFTRPIDRLTKAVQAMAEGAHDWKIEVGGAQELVILGQSFSRMRDAIQAKVADLAENNRRLNAEIGQRRLAEQERDRLASVLEATTDIVSMADPQGRILYFNRAARTLMGLETGATMPTAIPQVHPQWAADLVSQQGVPTAIRDGVWAGETALLNRDGREVPVSQVILSHKDTDGKLLYLSTIMRDVTERKHFELELQSLNATLEARVEARTRELQEALDILRSAQDELVRAEKLASLGSLVAGVAHELNTPIGNAVMVASTLGARQREFEAGMTEGLRRSALQAFLRDTHEVAEILDRNLRRAAELIGSFKQLAIDQSSYQRRSFEVAEVVQEIAMALIPTLRRSGVRLIDETPKGLLMDSFPGPMGQVLVNLVTNAVAHAFVDTPPGTVRINAQQLDAGRVCVIVTDDGCGIPRENLKRIFDPFFTTRLGQGGSGLGLHIVYSTVTGLLGGRIEVHSTPGQGTEFRIELPQTAPDKGDP